MRAGGTLHLAAAFAALLLVPATAPAAEVGRVLGSDLVGLSAAGGEVNRVTIAHDGTNHRFVDSSATLTAGNGCSQISPNEVSCPSIAGDTAFAFLSDGDDQVTSTTSFPTAICGGFGDDTVQTGPGLDGIFGEEGNDILRGGAERDVIQGEQRCQGQATGPPSHDTLDGEDGPDILQGGRGGDSMLGGPGNDTLFALAGGDSLDGGGGNDDLLGFEGDDSLSGGDGGDRLAGGEGADSQAGGAGNDVLGVTHADSGVVHLDEGDDSLDGGDGDDVLNGGPGSSPLSFGEPSVGPFESDVPNGADDLHGGDGKDTVSYAGRSAAVAVTKDGAADDGSMTERDNVRPDVDAVVGGSGHDELSGGAGPDEFDGGRGADVLQGGPGDDLLAGGPEDGGADMLLGGEGADSLRGQAGADMLRGGPGGDTLAGGGGSDTIAGEGGPDGVTGGTGLDSISGGPGDDDLDGSQPTLVGADGADRLEGDAGKDTLSGGPGDDILGGGAGDDSISGGMGIDAADYRGARRAVTVTLDGTANDGGPGERDSVHADVEGIRGNGEEDTFTGDGNSNPLAGGAGEDFIDGRAGSDDLRGGSGRDVLRSRDRDRDLVRCGAGRDFAIVDREDAVRSDCELIDRDGRSRPVVGIRAVVRPLRGEPRLRLPRMQRGVPLEDAASVPLPASIDARDAVVRVTAAVRGRRTRSATLRGGRALVGQRRGRALTAVRVLAPERRACRRGTGGRVLGRLTVRSRGGFRTRGRHASATGRRATWLTVERCGATLVRARRGEVVVIDRERGRRVLLGAGRAYLARTA